MNQIKSFLIAITSLFFGNICTTSAQQISNVKQYYSDTDFSVSLEHTIVMAPYKFLFLNASGSDGNIFYDGILIDKKDPINPERKRVFIIVKTNMKNELIEARSYNFLGGSEKAVTSSSELVFFTLYDENYNSNVEIIGIDVNFNLVFSKKLKNCQSVALAYKNENLYIQAANFRDPLIVGQDTIKHDYPEYHSTIKMDVKSGDIVWVTNAGREFTQVSPIQVTSKGEVYVAGFMGSGLAGGVWLQGDTLSVVGNTDGYIYKLDANGKKVFLKQFYGSGDDGIFQFILDENDNVYLDIFVNLSSNIRYDNKVYHLENIYPGTRLIMRLNEEGQGDWAKEIKGQWGSPAKMILLNDDLVLCYSYKSLEVDSFSDPTRSGGFIHLDKTTGDAKRFDRLNTINASGFRFGNSIVKEKLVTFSISLGDGLGDPLVFEGKQYLSPVPWANLITLVGDVDFSDVSNLDEEIDFPDVAVYPNPTSRGSTVTILSLQESYDKLQFYDIYGKLLDTVFGDHVYSYQVDHAVSPGIYFIVLSNDKSKVTNKLNIY